MVDQQRLGSKGIVRFVLLCNLSYKPCHVNREPNQDLKVNSLHESHNIKKPKNLYTLRCTERKNSHLLNATHKACQQMNNRLTLDCRAHIFRLRNKKNSLPSSRPVQCCTEDDYKDGKSNQK